MKRLWRVAVAFAVAATNAVAGQAASEGHRAISLAPSDPAASTRGDHVMPQGTHLTVYSFDVPGAKSVGLSLLDGPYYPITLGRSAEIFYVYDGSAVITQSNGHDVPVQKGDIVFVPRGVAYGGKNFVHYKHAYLVFDRGKEPVPGGPTQVTRLHPELLHSADFRTEGAARVHYFYHGGDGSSIRVWEAASPPSANLKGARVASAGEYTIVLEGSITLHSDGNTLTAHAGDVFFVPKGTSLSYTARDLEALTAVTTKDAR